MTDPYTLASDLLSRVVAFFAGAGIDLPESRYVAPGDSTTIAFDIPAVMVSLDWIALGQPGTDATGRPSWPSGLQYAQFAVTILRPVAGLDEDGDPPPVERISADGQTILTDAAVLLAALLAVRDGSQRDGGWVGPGMPQALGRVVTVGPQGTMAATVGTIQVGLM